MKKKESKPEHQPMTNAMRVRLNRVVAGAMALLLVYLGINLVNIAVLDQEFYRDHATRQQLSSKELYANRGTIYDTNGEILAQSATVWNVVVAPSIITQDRVYVEPLAIAEGDRERVVQDLARILTMDPEQVRTRMAVDQRFVRIKRNLKETELAQIKGYIEAGNEGVLLAKEAVAKGLSDILTLDFDKTVERMYKNTQYEVVKRKVEKPEADLIRQMIVQNEFTFITLLEDTKRYYPNNELLANVLGFTGSENQGVYGLEYQYDSILKGTNGKLLTATDGKGQPIPTNFEQKHDAIQGDSIVITIDQNIQRYTENALNELVKLHKPQGGATAIVMEVDTGGILAMASSKNYDPNRPSEIFSPLLQRELEKGGQNEAADAKQLEAKLREQQWGNDNLNKLYEPGSVYKIVTAAGALETGAAHPEDTFRCTGTYTVAGETMRCNLRTGHGTLTFKDAIVKSCNPSFIQMGLKMGADNFSHYFEQFGLQEATGIDLPGEAKKSIYVPLKKMGPVELASSSFGQTLAITPLQMITAISTVVNGGNLVQPHLLKQVLDQNNSISKTNQPDVRRQVISKENSLILRDAMEEMLESSVAYVPGYRIGGKSGTAQKGNKSDNGYYASFASFAPVDDPKIAVLVVADQPAGSSFYGSMVCGPAVGSITSETLAYLGVEPQFSEEELQNKNVSVPSVIGEDLKTATQKLKEKNLTVKIYGKGDKVVEQMPRGASIARGSKVILYTEPDMEPSMESVPNVMGLSPSEANKVLTDAGFTVSLQGQSVPGAETQVVHQNRSPGEKLPRGTPISIQYGAVVRDN